MCLGAPAHASKGLEGFCKICSSKEVSVVSVFLLGAMGGNTSLWPWPLGKPWPSSGISWQEVACSAVCKPRCMGWGFCQVEMMKVMQCYRQLLGLLIAQTFLKGLSRSWRSSELPSCGRWVVIWAVCLLLSMSCVFLHTPASTHPTLSLGYKLL